MVCVEEIPWMPAGSREEVIGEKELADRKFAEVVAKAEAEAKHHRVKLVSQILVGHAVPAIVDFIERDGFDLLVTGFMGHSALYNRVIGSTTDRLVELAPCTVLVVK
jgi:nucleotide-binding universal stress UspA family protein